MNLPATLKALFLLAWTLISVPFARIGMCFIRPLEKCTQRYLCVNSGGLFNAISDYSASVQHLSTQRCRCTVLCNLLTWNSRRVLTDQGRHYVWIYHRHYVSCTINVNFVFQTATWRTVQANYPGFAWSHMELGQVTLIWEYKRPYVILHPSHSNFCMVKNPVMLQTILEQFARKKLFWVCSIADSKSPHIELCQGNYRNSHQEIKSSYYYSHSALKY